MSSVPPCPECRGTVVHKMDCSRGEPRVTVPAREVPHAVAPESAPRRAEGSGGAQTPRERALLAINDGCLLGYDPPSAEDVVAALEAAGLRLVDAREHDAEREEIASLRARMRAIADVVPTLIAVRDDFLPTDDEQVGYGAFHGGDPRKFTPDPECSTEEERAAHKAACDAWDRGDEVEIRGGCEYREVEPGGELSAAVEEVRKGAAVATTGTALVRIQRQTFGLGTYVCRDPQVTEIVERINAAIVAMGGE